MGTQGNSRNIHSPQLSVLSPIFFAAASLLLFLLTACATTQSTPTPSLTRPVAEDTPAPVFTPVILSDNAAPTRPQTPTVTPTLHPSITPTLTPTPGPTQPGPTVNGLTLDQFIILPPEVMAHVQEIYAHGQRSGRNPHAFSKMGDSTVLNPKLLGLFDSPSRYTLGDYAYLQPTIEFFSGSFSRYGVAAQHGLHAWSVFDPLWADKDWCDTGEHMLACEIRLNNPALFIIRLGSNDAGAPSGFAKNVRDVVEYCLAYGVIPLLVTKADRFEGDNTNNDILRQIATEYAIPLWDFDRVADTLPERGLDTDQVHMKTATHHDYTLSETFTIGHSVQDLTGLMMLDALRQEGMGE